jgi:NADH-quinone oxidoreductase subunit J
VTLPDIIPIIGIRWDDLLFLILAAILIGSGLLVVTMKDIIRCGLAMIVCFGALAGLYVMLGSPVLAAAQVLVYIGAISVLVLFAIMLTQSKVGTTQLVFQTQAIPAAVAAVVLAVLVSLAAVATDWGAESARIWTVTEDFARLLYQDPGYLLAFEVVGVLLLAAVVGAVFLAKHDRPRSEP